MMEEQYISKLHPVVDYGAGVFLLIIGEFCLHILFACSLMMGRTGLPHPLLS